MAINGNLFGCTIALNRSHLLIVLKDGLKFKSIWWKYSCHQEKPKANPNLTDKLDTKLGHSMTVALLAVIMYSSNLQREF